MNNGASKILNLLNEASNSKFVTRKWKIVNDNSKSNYDAGNEITYNTEILKSNLYDFNIAYILVKGDITVTAAPATQVSFTNCLPITKCITKIGEQTVDDAGNLDLVMPMYNLIEYSWNYSETTRRLWFYSKDETTDFKPFKYKAKSLVNTEAQTANAANGILKSSTIAMSLRYLSNFWRSREMLSINSKVELKLKGTKYCVLRTAGADNEFNNDHNANNIILLSKIQNCMFLSSLYQQEAIKIIKTS